jgi:WD40 repeat protein
MFIARLSMKPALRLRSSFSLALAALLSAACASSPARTEFKAHDDPVLSIAISPDGVDIAASSADKTVVIWDREQGRQVAQLHIHNDWVTGVAFSPSLPQLASSGRDGNVFLWSTETWTRVGTPISLGQSIWALAYSPNGSTIALVLQDGSISLRDATTGGEVSLLVPEAKDTRSVAFSPDGSRLVATHAGDSQMAISATVWDIQTARNVAVLSGHGSTAQSLGTSQPDLADGLLQRGVTWGSVNSAAYSPDGRLLATAGGDGTVRLWDPSTSQLIATLVAPEASLYTVSFSNSGLSVFAGGSNGIGLLWDARTYEQILALPQVGIIAKDSGFTPDDQYLVVGYYDGSLRLWPIAPAGESPR